MDFWTAMGDETQSTRPIAGRTLLSVAALALCACGGAQRPNQRHGTPWFELTFASATLPAVRASGAPWHAASADRSSGLLGGLIGLAVGYPELGFALGSAMVDDPEPAAPAPYVVVKVDGVTYGLSPIGQTLAPRWRQPIAIPVGRRRGDAQALIQVLDAVDDGLLGQRKLTVDDLLAPGPRTLTDVGEVASLDLEARRMPGRPSVAFDLHVDAAVTLSTMQTEDVPGWRAIPVWNGDRVTVAARGEVCPSSRTSECFGPRGAEPGRWHDYSYNEFEDVPHASLVGLLPGQPVSIGDGSTFTVERSGLLLLFVNDTDVGNNSGGFDVHVEIAAP